MMNASNRIGRQRPVSRRGFLASLGAGTAAMAAYPGAAHARRARKDKPNVVVIVADDLGYGDIGLHGSKAISTPHIDALGRAGVRFTQGYVTYAACAPSRASLLTGRHHARIGFNTNPDRVKPTKPGNPPGLPPSEVTLAEALREQGYATGMVGKWHLGHTPDLHPQEQGFDEFYGFLGSLYRYFDLGNTQPPNGLLRGKERVKEEEYLTYAFAREAVGFIERHRDTPFFLYLAFNAVHTPLMDDRRPPDNAHITLKGSDDPRVNRRMYVRMVESMDESVGRVMQAIHDARLDKDTLVFFIGDNGGARETGAYDNYPLRDYKGTLYEGGIRVPYLLCWPAAIKPGTVYTRPVSAMDIFPTCLAAAGAAPAADGDIDGTDLTPYVTGKAEGDPHAVLYWQWAPELYAIRKGDWKLVKRPKADPELYDLAGDEGEAHDLAAERPQVAKGLNDLWQTWHDAQPEPLFVSDPEQWAAWRRAAGAKA